MYGQFKEMWEKDPSEDILLNLCTMFGERKTNRQILRKLKEMNLIQVRKYIHYQFITRLSMCSRGYLLACCTEELVILLYRILQCVVHLHAVCFIRDSL